MTTIHRCLNMLLITIACGVFMGVLVALPYLMAGLNGVI